MKYPIRLPLALTLLGALSGALVFGAAPAQEQALTTTPVAGNVSVVTATFGGNLGVSKGEDGLLLVDSLFGNTTSLVDEELARLGEGRPTFLVNTHTHGDHVGGNAHFAGESVVVAHENVRVRMKGEGVAGMPVVTYADGLSLHFNGEEIRLIHVPGAHTDGDTVVWFRGSNVFHLGDCYFELGYPYIDTGRGGNVRGVIAAVRQVLEMAPKDARFIPGHGKVTGRKELEEYVSMLETLTERVEAHLADGDDVKQMLALGVTEDLDKRWGNFPFVTPERMVGSIVASLKDE